jgi:hypothetical protein
MTPDVEERFQRIEALLMETATLSLKTQQQQEITQRQVNANAQAIADFRRDYEASIEDLMQLSVQTLNMASENITYIRGLQVENRRILRELRDRRQGNQ